MCVVSEAVFFCVCTNVRVCRSKLDRDKERDVTEQIALGVPSKTQAGNDSMFDQRLFGQTKASARGLVYVDEGGDW